MTLLDDVLPEWHYRERHRRRVEAEPERVFAAVREVTLHDTPVARILVGLRGLHARPDRPIFDQMRDYGFKVEAEEPGRELAFAAIGQPLSVCHQWSITGTPSSRLAQSPSAWTGRRCPPRRVCCSLTNEVAARSGATGS